MLMMSVCVANRFFICSALVRIGGKGLPEGGGGGGGVLLLAVLILHKEHQKERPPHLQIPCHSVFVARSIMLTVLLTEFAT